MIQDFPSQFRSKIAVVMLGIRLQARNYKSGEPFIFPSEAVLEWDNALPPRSELWDIIHSLEEEGVIEILKENGYGRRNIPYKWNIKLIQPAFRDLESEINKPLLKEERPATVSEKSSSSNVSSKGKIKKKLNEAKKKLELVGKKEKQLIEMLSDLEPHRTSTLKVAESPNALSQLKRKLNTKLRKVGFEIKTLPGSFSDPKHSYHLQLIAS